VSRTWAELHVEWNHLKRRMAASSGTSSKPAVPRFVELVAPRGESVPQCMIELEGRHFQAIRGPARWSEERERAYWRLPSR